MFKKFKYTTLKALVNTIGQTSNGLRLCKKHGFTSGKMLDYIYQNEPSGKLFIGKIIDSLFIRHVGWEVIRTRKNNLVSSLGKAIDLSLNGNKEVYIVDVASGPARYILEALDKHKNAIIFATCRDIDNRWLDEGQEKAKILGLDNIEFKLGDALNSDSYKLLRRTPDIIVSSGFYDWITDDEIIKKSIRIIYDNLKTGGYFVFTNQSGHVNLEMVQEVFSDFNGDPLRMTIRSADLMNTWTREAGFTVLETISDKAGYYSVTLAKK